MSPPTGRSNDPNGNMGDVGRTGRDPAVYAADASPDAGAPDGGPGPTAAPGSSGAEGSSGSSKWGIKPAPAQDPSRTPSPWTGKPDTEGSKSPPQ